jgi:ribosomal protein S18 acetylase RimI-like enzyme
MITQATILDIPAIRQIAETTWAETYGKILSAEQLKYMLDSIYSASSLEEQMRKEHQFFFFLENAKTIGFIDVEKISDEKTKLHKLYLLPNQQGKGYGKLLMNFALKKAKEQHSSVLQLNVNRFNAPAIRFYQKSGFSVVEEVDIPIGSGYFMNDFVMEKNIVQE